MGDTNVDLHQYFRLLPDASHTFSSPVPLLPPPVPRAHPACQAVTNPSTTVAKTSPIVATASVCVAQNFACLAPGRLLRPQGRAAGLKRRLCSTTAGRLFRSAWSTASICSLGLPNAEGFAVPLSRRLGLVIVASSNQPDVKFPGSSKWLSR